MAPLHAYFWSQISLLLMAFDAYRYSVTKVQFISRWALAIGDQMPLGLVREKKQLTFGSSSVPFQTSAKYLGAYLDETLSMNKISSLRRLSYFHLRKVSSIRPYLSNASTVKLV